MYMYIDSLFCKLWDLDQIHYPVVIIFNANPTAVTDFYHQWKIHIWFWSISQSIGNTSLFCNAFVKVLLHVKVTWHLTTCNFFHPSNQKRFWHLNIQPFLHFSEDEKISFSKLQQKIPMWQCLFQSATIFVRKVAQKIAVVTTLLRCFFFFFFYFFFFFHPETISKAV